MDTCVATWILVLNSALALGKTGATLPPIQFRLAGGNECEKNSKPWHVAVFVGKIYKCGGALIHPRWVLTAAHCKDRHYRVLLGHDYEFRLKPVNKFIKVIKNYPHPSFNMSILSSDVELAKKDFGHDLMLLHLMEPANITDTVKVVDLPTKDPKIGTTCVISGWGKYKPPTGKPVMPLNLQCMDLHIRPNTECNKLFAQNVTKSMLCARHEKGGKVICKGDSGSPLVCDDVLQGIASMGIPLCESHNFPSVFTRVTYYLDWIRNTMTSEA